jgi:hypothetical protein
MSKDIRTEYRDISGLEGVRIGQTAEEILGNPLVLKKYSAIYNGLKARLTPGYPVPDDVDIALIGNNTLLSETFRLRFADKMPIHDVANPGKSGHIAFERKSIILACLAMIDRGARKDDRLYVAPAPEFRQIGFSAVYAPTSRHPLHTRIVPNRLDKDGDIPESMRQELVAFLQQYKVEEARIPKNSPKWIPGR